MKTLFLTQDYPPDTGGIARLYGALSANFPRDAVEVVTVANPKARDEVTRMAWTQRDAKRLSNVLRWIRWLSRRLRAGHVDAIHAGNIRPTGYIAAWARKRHGIPYVIYVHGKDVMKELRRSRSSLRVRLTGRLIFGNASAIIANSRYTAALTRELLQQLKCRSNHVRVVHPGTDPRQFRRDERGAERWRNYLNARGPLLLSVARLMPRKGIDTTLHALARVAGEFPDIQYAVVGDGPDRERLNGLVEQGGVVGRVHFLGAVEDRDLPGLYTAADIFVLPVREERDDDEVEGFGIVYCEAAACGTAVIAGRSGGTSDAVRDQETGVLVPPDDPGALADAIANLLRDSVGRSALGAKGRASVEAYYNWKRAAADVWKILEGVVRDKV